jgi:hypothetical protein
MYKAIEARRTVLGVNEVRGNGDAAVNDTDRAKRPLAKLPASEGDLEVIRMSGTTRI